MVPFPTIPKSSERITRIAATPISNATIDAAIKRLVLRELKLKKKVLTRTAAAQSSPVEARFEKRILVLKSSHKHSSLDVDKSLDGF